VCSALTLVAGAASVDWISAQARPADLDSVAGFPDTPVGKLGQTLLEVINSDSTARTAFVVGQVSEAAVKEVSIADRAGWLARVYEESGGLEVLQATGSQPLEILVKTRRGDHWARIYAFTDPRQRDRLGDYGAVPLRDPAIERADRWPERHLSEAEVVREMDRRVAAAARRDEFSGVVLVAQGERTIFHRAYGLADRSWKIPNRLDTKFNLASMNKMFTVVAIAQLIEAGKLHLGETLGSILPDYPNQQAARTVTISQLLSPGSACCSIDRVSIGGNAIAPLRSTSHSLRPSHCCSSPAPHRPIATKGLWCSGRSWRSSPG
jgi:beta-lactamase family protein